MNDDFADSLVLPLCEAMEAMLRDGSEAAKVWADAEIPIRITLDDYWLSERMLTLAEEKLAELLSQHSVTRFVFAVPVSFDGTQNDLPVGPPGALGSHMIWFLCVDLAIGLDICAKFYGQRPNGEFIFEKDMVMLESDKGMQDGAPGFALLKGILANGVSA